MQVNVNARKTTKYYYRIKYNVKKKNPVKKLSVIRNAGVCNRGCGHAVDRRQSSQNFLEIRRASTVVNMYILLRVYTRVNIKMPPLVIYAGCEGSDISVLLR